MRAFLRELWRRQPWYLRTLVWLHVAAWVAAIAAILVDRLMRL